MRYHVWIILSCLIILCFFAGESAQAQQRARNYLELCNNGEMFCGGGLICAIESGSISGICVHACLVGGSQCPHREPCETMGGSMGGCICRSNANCPSGETCQSNQCGGVRRSGELCDQSNPCIRGYLCAQPTGSKESRCLPLCVGVVCPEKQPCVTAGEFSVCYCRNNDECRFSGISSVCVNGICKSTPNLGEDCTRLSQCAIGLLCIFDDVNATTGRCLPRCPGGIKDCLGGEVCQKINNQQVCRCDSRNPCRDGSACADGLCQGVTRCNQDRPCPEDTVCVIPSGSNAQGLCMRKCQKNADCQTENTTCRNVIGANSKACYCTLDSDCGKDGHCFALTCKKSCTDRSDCEFPQFCRDGVCVNPADGDIIGEPPPPRPDAGSSTPDRASQIPIPTCEPPCTEDFICRDGKCVKRTIGESCIRDSQCESDFCFGINPFTICSTNDCSQCNQYGLECQVISSQQGCLPRKPPPPDPTPDPSQGCCQASTQPSSEIAFILLIIFALWRERRTVAKS